MSEKKSIWFESKHVFYKFLSYLNLKETFRTFPLLSHNVYQWMRLRESWHVTCYLLTNHFGLWFLSDFYLVSLPSTVTDVTKHISKLMNDFKYLNCFKKCIGDCIVTKNDWYYYHLNSIVECGNSQLVIHWLYKVCYLTLLFNSQN